MKLIPNEYGVALDLLKKDKKDLGSKPTNTIRLLIKYYYHIGCSQDEVIANVLEFITQANGDNKSWIAKVKRDAKGLKDSKLHSVESVFISDVELEAISLIKKPTLEKLAFCLLVHCKVVNAIYGKQSEWVTIDKTSEVFKDMRVNRNTNEQDYLIGDLKRLGYVTIPKKTGSLGIKLNYIDIHSETCNGIVINSFNDYILDYHIYKGEKVIECKMCGERVLVKSKTCPPKYCKKCSVKAHSMQTNNSQKKKRVAEK